MVFKKFFEYVRRGLEKIINYNVKREVYHPAAGVAHHILYGDENNLKNSLESNSFPKENTTMRIAAAISLGYVGIDSSDGKLKEYLPEDKKHLIDQIEKDFGVLYKALNYSDGELSRTIAVLQNLSEIKKKVEKNTKEIEEKISKDLSNKSKDLASLDRILTSILKQDELEKDLKDINNTIENINKKIDKVEQELNCVKINLGYLPVGKYVEDVEGKLSGYKNEINKVNNLISEIKNLKNINVDDVIKEFINKYLEIRKSGSGEEDALRNAIGKYIKDHKSDKDLEDRLNKIKGFIGSLREFYKRIEGENSNRYKILDELSCAIDFHIELRKEIDSSRSVESAEKLDKLLSEESSSAESGKQRSEVKENVQEGELDEAIEKILPLPSGSQPSGQRVEEDIRPFDNDLSNLIRNAVNNSDIKNYIDPELASLLTYATLITLKHYIINRGKQ